MKLLPFKENDKYRQIIMIRIFPNENKTVTGRKYDIICDGVLQIVHESIVHSLNASPSRHPSEERTIKHPAPFRLH